MVMSDKELTLGNSNLCIGKDAGLYITDKQGIIEIRNSEGELLLFLKCPESKGGKFNLYFDLFDNFMIKDKDMNILCSGLSREIVDIFKDIHRYNEK